VLEGLMIGRVVGPCLLPPVEERHRRRNEKLHALTSAKRMATKPNDVLGLSDLKCVTETADALVAVGLAKRVGGGWRCALNGNVLFEGENKIVTTGTFDAIEVPKLKVHQAEPSKPANAMFEDIMFDDDLIAKMMANILSHGMTLADISG
jgi:hypothetical protein